MAKARFVQLSSGLEKMFDNAVNCENNKLMIAVGLRPRFINKFQFTKTPKLKKYLKKLKSQHKQRILRKGLNPKKVMNVDSQSILSEIFSYKDNKRGLFNNMSKASDLFN